MIMMLNDDNNHAVGYGDGVGVGGGRGLLPTAGDFFAVLLVAWRLWRRRHPFSLSETMLLLLLSLLSSFLRYRCHPARSVDGCIRATGDDYIRRVAAAIVCRR